MWFFLVLTIFLNGRGLVIKERYEFPTLESCVEIQRVVERELLELGGFIITKCESPIEVGSRLSLHLM